MVLLAHRNVIESVWFRYTNRVDLLVWVRATNHKFALRAGASEADVSISCDTLTVSAYYVVRLPTRLHFLSLANAPPVF